jgi:hypothetical protein
LALARRDARRSGDPRDLRGPGDFDLDVERRDWDDTYDPDLGT